MDDKFHIMQHANQAVDEVRRTEFFRQGKNKRGLVKGKRWLLLTRWVNLSQTGKQALNALFQMNRKLMKACLLNESLDRLCTYTYEGAMLRYLKEWLLDQMDGILNYYRTKAHRSCGSSERNINLLIRRGRGYQNLRYLLLKAQRMAATKTEFVVSRRQRKQCLRQTPAESPVLNGLPASRYKGFHCQLSNTEEVTLVPDGWRWATCLSYGESA